MVTNEVNHDDFLVLLQIFIKMTLLMLCVYTVIRTGRNTSEVVASASARTVDILNL